VPRRVDDHVVAQRRLEPDLRGVDGDRLVALRLEGVQHEGPLDRHAAARRDRLQLLHLARRQRAGVVQQPADQRRLAVVDVADDDDAVQRARTGLLLRQGLCLHLLARQGGDPVFLHLGTAFLHM
jgi:hypothetical protein